MTKPGRNDPCPCGSGRKYKHCCLKKDAAEQGGQRAARRGARSPAVHAALQRDMRAAAESRARGDLAGEEAALRRVSEYEPGMAEVHFNLANVLQDQSRLEEAAESYRRALELEPALTEAACNLGGVLRARGDTAGAIAVYRDALARRPGHLQVLFNLGNALKDEGRLEEAIACYREAIARKPDMADVHERLGYALVEAGDSPAALASFRAALALKPAHGLALENTLFLEAYQALVPSATYLATAREWERRMVPETERTAARARRFSRPPLAGRRLRVGYVSGDFRRHAVSFFAESLLARHDRSRVEVHAYYTVAGEDEVSARIRALADRWSNVADLDDARLRERIDADGIDVLVDLSGHTAHNRLGAFARRAAPVQAHYLGYFASTGLTEMDYWIGDRVVTPEGADAEFSERVWRLPRTWVSYAGSAEAPETAWRPAADGAVWFGSFNDLKKLTPASVALWSRLLQAVPAGRLLLKTKMLQDPGNRKRVHSAFAAHGVDAGRIELRDTQGTPGYAQHMATYDRIDVALDPVGAVGGGTTTCDALWMGAPVLTLAGDRMASRMTASMLEALGRREWIARSEDEYVAIAARVAGDVAGRGEARVAQRERMARSALCDAAGLARALEDAMIGMYERWEKA